MIRKIFIWALLLSICLTCNREAATAGKTGARMDVQQSNDNELIIADQVDLKRLYEKKILKFRKINMSSGDGKTLLFDQRVDTGWITQYSESKKPWLEIIIQVPPDQISEVHVLPYCSSKEGKYNSFGKVKKIKIKYFGVVNVSKNKIRRDADVDTHAFSINEKGDIDVGGDLWSSENQGWFRGIIDDINAGDDRIYATKIRITVLEVEKKESDMICVGEVIVTAIR